MTDNASGAPRPSILHGTPLDEEKGIGALTLGGYFREVVGRFGPQEAAVAQTLGERDSWTYDELWRQSMAVARSLVTCGVGPGMRVGILSTNRLEFLAALFGTAMAGGIATPISTFYTAPELDAVLKASTCSILLFERHVLKKDFYELLTQLEPAIAVAAPNGLSSLRFPFLRHVVALDLDCQEGAVDGWQEFLARGASVSDALVERRMADIAPSDPGLLFFSSGSTGQAKGILSAHRGVCLQLWRWPGWFALATPVRSWSANAFFWSGTFSMALGGTLSSGGTLILQRYFDADEALRLMETERATMLLAWPHQWAQIEAASTYDAADLSAMTYLPCDTPLARHPTVTTTWRDPRGYGSTETFTLISIFPSDTPVEVVGGSYGQPTAGSTIKIVDPLSGATVPLGERGEIAVKGPTLMLGYIGTPQAQTLDEEGFFRTGDGGYADAQGRLFWEGRLNDIIKTGGANVSPLEVDAVLRDCPSVMVSQTVGVPDDLLGEIVVSCIVLQPGTVLDAQDLCGRARQKLASYKVPRRILFFTEDELETTGSAKIKTAELRQLAARRLVAEAASTAS